MKRKNSSSVIGYKISGSGMKRAVQESVNTKTNIDFVWDKDQKGNFLRIGYALVSRDTKKRVGPIKWFKKNEIDISET